MTVWFLVFCWGGFWVALLAEAVGRVSPRRASHFLLSRQEKVTKEKATPLSVSLRFATGNLRCSEKAGVRRTRSTSLRSDSCGPYPAFSCAPRHSQRGSGSTRQGASLCGVRECEGPGCSSTGAERSDGPLGIRGRAQRWPDPPSGCAEERSVSRIRARSCLSEASSARPRETRAPQVARSEAEGRRQWGRLFFAYFLLAKQKKVGPPPGGIPGSCLSKNKTFEKDRQAPNQCTLNNLSESTQTAPGRNPAFTAKARNPSTVNLCEYSV